METNDMKLIRLELGKECPDTVLFRNNTGMAWQGDVRKNDDGSITIKNPRPLHAGLCEGGSDLIGWTPVLITQDMVGRKMAIFTALEIKRLKGVTRPKQINFVRVIKEAGGKAGIVRTPKEGVDVVRS